MNDTPARRHLPLALPLSWLAALVALTAAPAAWSCPTPGQVAGASPAMQPPQAPWAVEEAPPADLAAVERRVQAYVNRIRVSAGLQPLVWESALRRSARAHSREMYELGYFSHTSPVAAHRDLADRMRATGMADFRSAGENLATRRWSGPRPVDEDVAWELVRSWMESPGHRAAILDPSYTMAAVGVWGDDQEVLATQHFASLWQRYGAGDGDYGTWSMR